MSSLPSRVDPDLGAGLVPLVETPANALRGVLTELLNRLSHLEHDVVLVLDDYHLVDGPDGPLRRESTHPRQSGPDDHGLEPRRRPHCRNGFLNRLKPPGQRRPASIERDVA